MITEFEKNKFHVMTPIIMAIILGIMTFSTQQPLIVLAILFLLSTIFFISKSGKKLRAGFKIFIPFAIFTIVINFIFVQGGNIIIFKFLGRTFTLEALIYAFVFSIKLLNIIYIFGILGIMIDSDKAVSYFSSIIPKTTLSVLISIKLFPNMKNRFVNLKEIYKIRGVNYQGKTTKEKIKSYIPILSIILEDSLEGSFDIGEAAYVRGFLSGKRTIYEKQSFTIKDYIFIFLNLVLFSLYILFSVKGKLSFDVYSGITWIQVLNYPVAIIITVILIIFLYMEIIF